MNEIPMGVQLYTLAMYEIEFVEHDLKRFSLDKHQFLYLVIASVFPGIIQSTVSQYFNVNKSTASRMILKLVDQNLLRREKSDNERDFNIYLTSEGEKMQSTIFESIEKYETLMLQNVENKMGFKTLFREIFDNTRGTRKENTKKWKNQMKIK